MIYLQIVHIIYNVSYPVSNTRRNKKSIKGYTRNETVNQYNLLRKKESNEKGTQKKKENTNKEKKLHNLKN